MHYISVSSGSYIDDQCRGPSIKDKDHLAGYQTSNKGDRGDGTEGGEEILAYGHTDGPIKGSTRGPRGP